jgi:membrane protein
MGERAASAVRGWVDQAAESGALASAVGIVALLFGASRVAIQLRSALNQIWNVDEAQADSFQKSVRTYLQRRFTAFGMILASGPLLLAIFLSRAVLMGLYELVLGAEAGATVQALHVAFSIGLVAILTGAVFAFVPDVDVPRPSIVAGALLTSLIFNAGNILVGLYIARAGVAATYGAAGSMLVVLLWLYLSAQLFLLGAEFTQVHARRFGPGSDQSP